MGKRGYVVIASGFVGLIALLSVTSTVFAAADPNTTAREAITMSPSTKKYTADLGDTFEGSFKVINTGETTYDFIVFSKPYSVSGENYSPDYDDESAPRADAFGWVTFDTTEGTLAPSESAEINFTVAVPEGASLGGHYAALFAKTKVSKDDTGQVGREKSVGSILRIDVGGDVNEQGTILGSSIPFFQSSPPLTATIRAKNTGNVDYMVNSSITITDIFGNVKYTDSKVNTVYPDTTRAIEYSWDGASWIGFYRVKLSAEYLTGGYAEYGRVLILPRWLIALLVILIVGGAYAAFARRRRR